METTEISERRISVSGVLKILGVSLSGYKAWKKRKPSKTELRRNKIKEEIVDIYNASYQNYEHANKLVFEYIDAFYNTIRIHSHCDYSSPCDFEDLYFNSLCKKIRHAY